MKNLKVLSFALLFSVLVIAGCEKANNSEKVSCEGDDVCPVEETVETPSIEVEEEPSVVVEANDEEVQVEEPADEPMMRKMVVDENATAEEIEQDMVNTCANAGGTWADGVCTLEDGSVVAF